MNELFPLEKELKFEDIFLTVKYEGPSFDGVMNIQDLGNELLGLEYCIKTILKELLKEAKKSTKNKELVDELKNFNLEDIEIITEGFVDNCFLKKLKFWGKDKGKFEKFLDEIEKRPELMKFLTTLLKSGLTLYGVIYVSQIGLNSDILKIALSKGKVSSGIIQNIQKSNIGDTSKKIALELIGNNKYREASAKTVIPIRNKDDYLELSSPVLNEKIKIDNSNKKIFLLNTKNIEEEENEIQKYDKILGRISSINLDANKNQIGFKVANEGAEIKCHLNENLNIGDYKEGYLGEWVEIEGIIHYTYEKVNYIEINKIIKTTTPLGEAEQISMN